MRLAALLFVLAFGLAGCAATDSRPLHTALGGVEGIEELADELLYRASRDQRTARFWEGVDLDRTHKFLSEFICELADGPCTYTGAEMVEAHRGLGVDVAAFNALVEILIDSMEHLAISVPTQNRLLAELSPMIDDVVQE